MERIVALVEGHTEVRFVETAYGNAIVQRPFPNGKDVDVGLIADIVLERLETIDGSVGSVVVLLDRERRHVGAAVLRAELIQLIAPNIGQRQLFVGVSDLMFENWILADEAKVEMIFGVQGYAYCGDGAHGKARLRALNDNFDASPADKARWMKSCSAIRVAARSPSFAEFLESISFDWDWAQR